MKKLKTIILAGGSGTRLWPISRETSPKQFAILSELWGKSLFQLTLERASKVSNLEDIYVVASKENYFHALIQSEKLGLPISKDNIIIQPLVKETLPIIALATREVWEWNILVMPSDHLISDLDKFAETINFWVENTDKWIITFWIKPTNPETGYGYIEKRSPEDMISKVKKFHEKPNEDKAKKYIDEGYLWNSWMYLYDQKIFFAELENHAPWINKLILDKSLSDLDIFKEVKAISIDKWLTEKIDNLHCINIDFYWTDLWSFDAIWDYMLQTNKKHPNILEEGKVEDNVVLSESKNKEIALIDVKDLVIVDSDDVLLIAKKWSTQKVKQITKKTTKKIGLTEYRPWGSFRILWEWTGYKTKKITVLPGKKLSLQSHNHRSEHWVVVSWTALVIIWDQEKLVTKGESVFVPIWVKHRLENPWKMPLIVVESQIWDYLEEDDIIRYSDDFGRN